MKVCKVWILVAPPVRLGAPVKNMMVHSPATAHITGSSKIHAIRI